VDFLLFLEGVIGPITKAGNGLDPPPCLRYLHLINDEVHSRFPALKMWWPRLADRHLSPPVYW
jgi:hypothetical protein